VNRPVARSRALARATPQQGLTLIEVVVVLALVGVLLLAAVPSVRAIAGVDLRSASRELAASLRYVYDEASVRNIVMRIAYDLDNRTWWVEAADSDVRIFSNRRDKEAFDDFMEKKRESDEEVMKRAELRKGNEPLIGELGAMVGGDGAGAGGMNSLLGGMLGGGGLSARSGVGRYAVNQFSPIGDIDEAFERRKLPGSTRFWGVWTPQYDEVLKPMDEFEAEAMLREEEADQEWRVVYTHIFPGGYMEDTVVYLSDESGESITSLVVDPLIGRVRTIHDKVEIPDTRDRDRSLN
jgi:prepilin-type N-terminal cleavage/methylation domain-containing protein